MKYYCVGNPIVLIKTHYSDKWYSNMPLFGTPLFGKLPMTQSRMRSVYEESQRLVLCKTLEDANALRQTRNLFYDRNYPGVSSTLGPRHDYAIYEVEVDDEIENRFSSLKDETRKQEEIEQIIDIGDCCRATPRKDRAGLPDIAVYQANKSDLSIHLISGHYLSLIDGREEVEEDSMCRIL